MPYKVPILSWTLAREYAYDVNRAYGDAHELFPRAYECASVFVHIRLHGHVHDARHRDGVHVREESFHEHGHAHAPHSLKIAFQQP